MRKFICLMLGILFLTFGLVIVLSLERVVSEEVSRARGKQGVIGRLTEAVRVYKEKNGVFPSSLDDPELTDVMYDDFPNGGEMPAPIMGAPLPDVEGLVYKTEGDVVTIYWAGLNGQDDGGKGDDVTGKATPDESIYPLYEPLPARKTGGAAVLLGLGAILFICGLIPEKKKAAE